VTGEGKDSATTDQAREHKFSATAILKAAGLVISVIAGAATLLFTLNPDLKPCLGGYEAQFTGAPVFPRANYKAYLKRQGKSTKTIAYAAAKRGAEIRMSFRVSGLRGNKLTFRSSLVSIKTDGTLGAVDPHWDSERGRSITPQTCSEAVGRDLFVEVARRRPSRYRVVLELYRGNERLSLTQTAVFSD
jgi:hypothetical protein